MLRYLSIALCALLLMARAASAQVTVLEPLVNGLSTPVLLTHSHDGTNRKFIVEQTGRILVMQPGASTTSEFLNIASRIVSGGEQGLLGLTFHPQYASNGRFFVNYTRAADGDTVIAEYRVSANDPNVADPASESVLLIIDQPFSNHNGGMVEFGPDGFLYVAMGDGGSGNDPQNFAQNINELLGKMLRLDVDHPAGGLPYSSPPANPFFGPTAGRDEIYATGFRNPWRFSFDRLTGELYLGDVGQSSREEVDIVVRGGNYGWRVFEGTRCTNLGPASCALLPAIAPITEYVNGQSGRCAVTGGYVYRGTRRSLPYGAYVFGDFCSGEIFLYQGGVPAVVLDTPLLISGFGEDESGEIFVVSNQGSISRIASTAPSEVSERPFSLPGRAAISLPSSGSGRAFETGFASVEADLGSVVPSSQVIFSWRERGILVSEATIAAAPLVPSGRIFALISPAVTTGIAIANPDSLPVTLDFSFNDANGQEIRSGRTTIPANSQFSAFLDESPFNGTAMEGTFTFRASTPVAAIAISGRINERSEFLLATLPIVPITGTVLDGTIFPHFAQGGGWTTEFLLVNPSDAFITGVINVTSNEGIAAEVLAYSIPPRASRRFSPASGGTGIRVGWARMVATGGSLPSGVAIFRLATPAGTVTEAGVPAIAPGNAFFGYGELSAAVRSGLAVSSLSLAPSTINIELRDLDGSIRDTATINLPALGQRALFLDEMPGFNAISPFQGTVRVSSIASIAVTALRSRINERGDFLITASAPEDESDLLLSSELFFPHLAIGGGYDMQFVFINPQTGNTSGTVLFMDEEGDPLPLSVP